MSDQANQQDQADDPKTQFDKSYVDVDPDVNDTTETPPVHAFGTGGDFSIVDSFKEELQELVDAKEVYIPVKGYEKTGLTIKYHMPENGKELDIIATRIMRQDKDKYFQNLHIAMDTILHLCDGLYVQPDGISEPVMLDPTESGVPVDFGDERLVALIGASSNDPRVVLKRLFGGNEQALTSHAERLNRWLTNTKANLNLEVWQLGE